MENAVVSIGHNNPPDPIDEALAPFGDFIEESEAWLDGEKVSDEGQMDAVDALIAGLRKAKTTLAKAEKSTTAPLHDAWKAEIARWKPTREDIERRLTGLVAAVDPFKRALAEQKEAAKREAYQKAQEAEREARKAAEKADPSNYEAATQAAQLAQEAADLKNAAATANKDTVKGMRTVTKYAIEDDRAALHWIAKNDKAAMAEFIAEYVRRNHKGAAIDGVNVWTEKESY